MLARLLRLTALLLLGLLAIFIEAAPLGHEARSMVSPDLLFLVVAHFSIRRPGSTALLAVFGLGLVRDLLTDVPPGLGMLTLLGASEALKRLNPFFRRTSFGTEWLAVAVSLLLVLALQWLGLVLVLVQPPALSLLGQQWAISVALYPLIALVLRWMLRIGWAAPRTAE